MNNHPIHFRLIIVFLIVLSFTLLGASLYFQLIKHLEPCPLCIAQRLSIVCLLVSYIVNLLIKKNISQCINTFFQLLFSVFGAGMAGRQIWLMHVPPAQRPGCMPDISLLWQYLPFSDFIRAFLNGTESCTESAWTLWGFTMPEWTLSFFIFFILASILLPFFKKSLQ